MGVRRIYADPRGYVLVDPWILAKLERIIGLDIYTSARRCGQSRQDLPVGTITKNGYNGASLAFSFGQLYSGDDVETFLVEKSVDHRYRL
jgi:hypothetical protein